MKIHHRLHPLRGLSTKFPTLPAVMIVIFIALCTNEIPAKSLKVFWFARFDAGHIEGVEKSLTVLAVPNSM